MISNGEREEIQATDRKVRLTTSLLMAITPLPLAIASLTGEFIVFGAFAMVGIPIIAAIILGVYHRSGGYARSKLVPRIKLKSDVWMVLCILVPLLILYTYVFLGNG